MSENNVREDVVNILGILANRIEVKAVKIIKADKMVAWGRLWRSIKTKVDEEGLAIDVYADESIAPYAQYVHEGREPGKMPPVRPLEEWARKKRLLANREEAKGVKLTVRRNERATLTDKQKKLQDMYEGMAWGIAKKIRREGMRPRRFLVEAILQAVAE